MPTPEIPTPGPDGSNWLGLLPGTGSIGIYELMHGEIELVPILRPANSDLNLTLARIRSAIKQQLEQLPSHDEFVQECCASPVAMQKA